MFHEASNFNQSLGDWNVENINSFDAFISSSGMSTTNYDNLLIEWSQINLQPNAGFGAHNISFCASNARQNIINDFGWNFADAGLGQSCRVGIVETENQTSVYPNPVKSNLSIEFLNTDIFNYSIEIIDIQGLTVYKAKNKSDLNLNTIKKGIYFLNIQTSDGKIETHRIIKE